MVDWHLLSGERKIHEAKMSRIVFWNYYFFAVILLAVSAAVNFVDFAAYGAPEIPRLQTSGALILIASIVVLLAERFTTREMVLLTTERVLVRKRGLADAEMEDSDMKKGVASSFGSVRMEALKLETITNVQVRQSIGHRLLGIGDLVILAGYEEHIIKDLHNPFEIERVIYRVIEKKNEMRKNQ